VRKQLFGRHVVGQQRIQQLASDARGAQQRTPGGGFVSWG
jgi:hypothetical protein